MHEYGKTNWEGLWEKLEQDGNVGLDYVINPYLYAHVIRYLSNHPKALVVDFGCGTNVMGIQLLFGYQPSIAALAENNQLGHARFNTLLYLGVEGSGELVQQSQRYLQDIGNPRNIATVQSHIDQHFSLLNDQRFNLCISRNFLMHLSLEDYEAHMKYVSPILSENGAYIFSTLNPTYELLKAGKTLANGEKYDFAHGKKGEYGTFYHFYKTFEWQREIMEKYFTVQTVESCTPITTAFKKTHERYYEKEPIAHVYVLKPKKAN